MKRTSVMALVIGLLVVPAISGPTANVEMLGVQLELRLNEHIYRIGEPVEMTLALNNPGGAVARFEFPTGQMYDFIVLRDGQLIWQWSSGKAFTQAFTTLTLRPGEAKVFAERWNQRNAHGQQVPSGRYDMAVVFPVGGGQVLPARPAGPQVRFTIVSGANPSGRQRIPSVTSHETVLPGGMVGEVLVNHQVALRIRMAAGGFSASTRAQIVAMRLRNLLARGLTPRELMVIPVGREEAIMWHDQLVVTVDAKHARLNHTTPRALALEWLKMLTQALSPGR